MSADFLKTSYRSLWRKKSFTLLNIMGLAIGIAASLLIFLVIRNEISFDGHHKNADRIYRIVSTQKSRSNGEINNYVTGVPVPLPDALRRDFPQFEKVSGYWSLGGAQIYLPGKDMSDEKRFKENEGLFFLGPDAFEIFDYTWIAGNASALKDPHTAVLTQSLAEKYFGNYSNALGKTIQMWSFRVPYRIVGVFKDLPANTDIPVRMAASYATLPSLNPGAFSNDQDAWASNNGGLQCFVLLKKGQSAEKLQSQLPAFVKKYYLQDQDRKSVVTTNLVLQPLRKIHFDKRFYTFKDGGLSAKELWSLGLIGIFLLMVACINFINLATALSVNRAKEIGVRKVMGGNRLQLMKQFLQETGIIALLSLIAACILAQLAIPFLNDLMHKNLALHLFQQPSTILFLLLTGAIVTILAGLYPAIILSGFSPVMAFRNNVNMKTGGGLSLRRGLVVFQFVIAQLLIIGTVVVIKQMQYFRKQPIGLEKDGIALINLPSDSALKVKYPLLISRISQVPGVVATSLCMEAPANFWSWTSSVYFNDLTRQNFNISRHFADTGYYKTFGIQLLAGRLPFHSDTTREIVVNETTVKKLGLQSPGDIIGKTMSFDGESQFPVVGVVKNFNSRSLHQQIDPEVISPESGTYEWIAVRMDRNNMKSTLEQVQKTFAELYPTYLYDRYFFDERLERFYTSEAITTQLFKIFSFLAIFISCLGLYGLVSFMAVQKTKEVGIRKVLGASIQSIVYLFSKEFTLLIFIAFLIAAPSGYYFMNLWLKGFYYHTDIGWGVFGLAIILSVVIAWITVGYKALKAALANPVRSLRSE